MKVINAPHLAAPIRASTLPSRRLAIAFHSQLELAVPLTYVHGIHTHPNGPHEATEPVAVVFVGAVPTPYNHLVING